MHCFILRLVAILTVLPPNTGTFEDVKIHDKADSMGCSYLQTGPWNSSVQDNCTVYGTVANCSLLNLTNVPQNLPSNITALILSHNKIEEIPGMALAKYYALKCLDISYNMLSVLKNDSFENLSLVEYLDLRKNKLAMNEILQSSHYQPGFLGPLKNLKALDLGKNQQACLDDLIPLLSSLTESNVTYLNLQNIVNRYMPGVTVSKEVAGSLPRHLRTLIFSGNSLADVQPEVIDSLPKTLTNLDISDNRLTFWAYLRNFSKLESLAVLKLNGRIFSLQKYIPPDTRNNCTQSVSHVSESVRSKRSNNNSLLRLPPYLETIEIKTAGWSFYLTEFSIDSNNSLTNLTMSGNNIERLEGPIKGLYMLRQLEFVTCSIYFISTHFFDHFPSLEKLNLSTNLFGRYTLSKGMPPVFKSLKHLKELDLSLTDIVTISDRAFEGLDSLEKLRIESNPIYYFEVQISHMVNLVFINFSYTELANLNRLTIFQLNNITRQGKDGLTIDFSEVPIRCVCENLFFLNWLVTANVTLINSGHNKCVFADSTEQFVNDNFQEIYYKLDRKCVPEIALFVGISAATFIMLCFIIGSIIYRFRWKLRYLYHSAYISLKAKKDHANTGEQFEYDVFISYVSDDHTFVHKTLYPKLQSFGLKVHLHGLHFVAGEYIASNIVSAVQSSRYTLVVLTRHLLGSIWCKFELQMANMEHVHTGRPVLVFLLMEDLSKRELGTELLYHIQNSTYIKYPDEHQTDREKEIFWRKLASDLST